MTATAPDRQQSDDALAVLLANWLPSQRWFAGKGGELGPVTIASRSTVTDDHDGARIEHVILQVHTSVGTQHYQLFLGWRSALTDRLAHSTVGSLDGETVYDALHESSVSSRLLSGIAGNESWGDLRLSAEPDADIDPEAPGLVIGGEQSNTSIIFGDSAILKVYRRIEPGINPDVDIHRALKAAGSKHVAAPLGVIEADVSGQNTTLGFMASFFANSADGWAMATASVRDLMAEGDLRADEVGGDFAAEASRLGQAVAEVHRDLAVAFGTDEVDAEGWQHTVDQMIAEAERVAAQVPSLASQLEGIRATFEAARSAGSAAARQRIHGDLHLGQTLRTLHGWAVIDFEGEPSKPLSERREKQMLGKDIAGMLRSLDYAAHHLLPGGAADQQQTYRAAEWAARNRKAFLDGYAKAAGADQVGTIGPPELVRAVELDKAVYEVAYEHGNRPSWEPIPLHAVALLIKAGGNA